MDNNDFMYVVIVCKYNDIKEDKRLQILIWTLWTRTVPGLSNMVTYNMVTYNMVLHVHLFQKSSCLSEKYGRLRSLIKNFSINCCHIACDYTGYIFLHHEIKE